MDKTIHITLPTKIEKLLRLFLLMYPLEYRRKFGSEITWIFLQMYEEEVKKNGKIGVVFWIFQFGDIFKGIVEQHILFIQKKGIIKYIQQILYINIYNIVGAIFLLPISLMLFIDFISRILQGDITHYSRPVYIYLSHTFLYSYPILFTWAILLPMLAVLINLIPVLKNYITNHSVTSLLFIMENIVSIGILLIGLGFVTLIRLHDFAPCVVHGIFSHGLFQFSEILTICKKA